MTKSAHGNLEFIDPQAQKVGELSHLAGLLEIEIADVMAMGDHFNDVTMLKVAGIGDAIGNAEAKIKELADLVTKTNIEHGAAFAIEGMLNKKL
ncbi:HAD hydrolase family protein [Alkalihalobacillus sp. MEB130]|uniref:HAD hydrolase family protein n=1 Tax=Alkalihalobacillus sp. MEB130 TaxID=2976704 RepID=UPI0028E075A0|nr:HAD hydrolase family protein [Alkalihalobacillus sp. MEB130]MDT8862865.1 HAD hydrolase family protein [Alkalihalobacillus sp. MEB130]